jgi:2-polyprenyl-6-hydroxyphenyl methylase/3-demethylubiquinone-9 3-methyltransferase
MLHKLNPVRLGYIRDWIDQHWALDEHSRRPLAGKTALDVGCGAGLLAEPLARLGAKVTAIDPTPELISVARDHAAGQGLDIDYRVSAVEDLDGTFDLITSMEVIEHTVDPQQFLNDLAKRLAPNGLLMMSTPNATAWSKLITITLAEGFGAIPKGTHDFDKFIAPEGMKQLMANAGLKCLDIEGIAFSPTRGLHLSEDLRLNYLAAATRD